jgi:hypothetical protein
MVGVSCLAPAVLTHLGAFFVRSEEQPKRSACRRKLSQFSPHLLLLLPDTTLCANADF